MSLASVIIFPIEPFVLQNDSECILNYFELNDCGATDNEKRAFLIDGETTAITIRIPKNLKESVVEAASLKGLSFSAYVRSCLMDSLVDSK